MGVDKRKRISKIMGKYYVRSGQVRAVISAPHIQSPEDAACEAMLTYLQEGVNVAPKIAVSQRGFDLFNHDINEDVIFDTEEILVKSGFIFEDDE